MPGLCGFTHKNKAASSILPVLKNMRQMMLHREYYKCGNLYADENIAATCCLVDQRNQVDRPNKHDDLAIWLDGEFYNADELTHSEENDIDLLARLYRANNNFSFFEKIDGIFSAVIYDCMQEKIHLLTDRYGFRPLYWASVNGNLAWASELKAFVSLPEFTPKVNQLGVNQFLRTGQLLGNTSLLAGVELIPSGSVLTWDIVKRSYTTRRLWWWDNIQPLQGKIHEMDVAAELGRLFINAVKRRVNSRQRFAQSLSGGLDSRAIVAAAPPDCPLSSFTFGLKNSEDVKIAQEVARIKNIPHHLWELSGKNWFFPRLEGIWLTDGQLNLMHMHGIEYGDTLRTICDIHLNGFAGDLVMGGSYLKEKNYFDRPVDSGMQLMKDLGYSDFLHVIDLDEYASTNKTDYFFIQNRVRRFTLQGSIHICCKVNERKPFFDNKLIDFMYSIPDKTRYKSGIYNKMLLQFFPDFYKKIPWQKTGMPISDSFLVNSKNYALKKIGNKSKKIINLFKDRKYVHKEYTDYPNWLRQNPAKGFIEYLFNGSEPLCLNYIEKDRILFPLNKIMNGSNETLYTQNLCLIVTFEIWLRQLLLGELRTPDSFPIHLKQGGRQTCNPLPRLNSTTPSQD